MSQPQSTELMLHSHSMVSMASGIYLVKIGSAESCPEAAAAWDRIMTALEAEALALRESAELERGVIPALAGNQE
ncbi:hypothetical protein [Acetobacter sp.]|uniref:hypothetical protein n=1 Tax=Acetobacter sp. TaxID=440 RepID=UPI0039E76E19